MGQFTRGQLTALPVRLHTSLTLEDLQKRMSNRPYVPMADEPGSGWGSSDDDDEVIGLPATAGLEVGHASIEVSSAPLEGATGSYQIAKRLRARLYWDQPNSAVIRATEHELLANQTQWARWHQRDAVDLVFFEEEGEDSYAVLISARDVRKVRARVFPLLDALLDDGEEGRESGDRLEADQLPESLEPDFFSWLLYRLNTNPSVGDCLSLTAIDELSSRDRLLRGARFTDRATLERVELAALILMGDPRFGPAKVDVLDDLLEAEFHFQIELDGGFKAYRTSDYDDRGLANVDLGHALVEDIWSTVLPRLRHAYRDDAGWRNGGRSSLATSAETLIRTILPA